MLLVEKYVLHITQLKELIFRNMYQYNIYVGKRDRKREIAFTKKEAMRQI